MCRYFVVCKIGDSCQCILIDTQSSQGHLIPLDIPDFPWSTIIIDFIVKLPVSSCFDSIYVIVDQFSKAANFISGIKKLDASSLTGLLISHFFAITVYQIRLSPIVAPLLFWCFGWLFIWLFGFSWLLLPPNTQRPSVRQSAQIKPLKPARSTFVYIARMIGLIWFPVVEGIQLQ